MTRAQPPYPPPDSPGPVPLGGQGAGPEDDAGGAGEEPTESQLTGAEEQAWATGGWSGEEWAEADWAAEGFEAEGYGTSGYEGAGYEAAGPESTGLEGAGYEDAGYGDAGYEDAGYEGTGAHPAGAAYDEVEGYDAGPGDEQGLSYLDAPYRQGGYRQASYGEEAYGDGDYEAEGGDSGLAGEGAPGEGGAGAHALPPAGRPGRRRKVLTVLAALVVVVVLVAVIASVRVRDDINPDGRPGAVVVVHIPKGSSTAAIGRVLAKAGVIHGSTVFELYVKLEGAGPLYPGTYRLATNEHYAAVIAALEAGPPVLTRTLVVPEGFTVAQMANAVAKLKAIGITAAQFDSAARGGQVSSPYLPAGHTNLEGLLFPATYPVQQGESADELVQYMAETFQQYAGPLGLEPGHAVAISSPYSTKPVRYTPYQVITVASIVEREAKFNADRGLIASAIYNRLAEGMDLGAESTLLYGLGNPVGGANINSDTPNPYNTLLHHGLPPTPISSPGLPSLKAALHPPRTDYLYWVEVNPDGKMGYASTNAGFVKLEHECRAAKLC